MEEEVRLQRKYYKETAYKYDEMHVDEYGEHDRAMRFMVAFLDEFDCGSILDIGSGTGRLIHYIKERQPEITVIGIEPSPELRDRGYSKGIGEAELIDGDAQDMEFPDESFDIVCEFGALHHIPRPDLAVREMLRVSKKAIFISDSNNFGQGSSTTRAIKQIINACRLWKVADYIKTGGKGYTISEGDGLAYSYSVFNNYKLIAECCEEVLVVNTLGISTNHYRQASHVALLGIK